MQLQQRGQQDEQREEDAETDMKRVSAVQVGECHIATGRHDASKDEHGEVVGAVDDDAGNDAAGAHEHPAQQQSKKERMGHLRRVDMRQCENRGRYDHCERLTVAPAEQRAYHRATEHHLLAYRHAHHNGEIAKGRAEQTFISLRNIGEERQVLVKPHRRNDGPE